MGPKGVNNMKNGDNVSRSNGLTAKLALILPVVFLLIGI